MRELKGLSDTIIIKPADKGSAVVLQDVTDYIQEGQRQLSDRQFYHKVDHDLSSDHMHAIEDIVEVMRAKKDICKKVRDYLLHFPMRTSRFYMLPKIHKDKFPPPGRPIISGNGCPTERISQFVDFFLKEVAPKGRSFLKDTTNFLQCINEILVIPSDCLLVTLDVTSLYTNIPNSEGIRAAEIALEESRPGGQCSTNNSLIDLLRLVLTCNNFTFHGENYLQVGGTAMGTKATPNYDVNFMNYFEDRFVYTYFIQPLVWKRYIDDIFMLWQYGKCSLDAFISHLNSVHPSIKFTAEISLYKADFLDTTVHKSPEGNLWTDLFCKPTDTHSYLSTNLHIYRIAKRVSLTASSYVLDGSAPEKRISPNIV